ncbi:Protein involved in maintenance of golgi structure and er-golgi transport [Fasciola gigantica]|uniref:Protein involved in maintenance of golgi structure and er-golgi transport n=1 Tax=Fasciola gigantica TaxID=46835 RepID=A0A504YL61_FASGI|nr:Protein involved in maintenance of golgi structure and er-golgi transport [Fasciola gigantica]
MEQSELIPDQPETKRGSTSVLETASVDPKLSPNPEMHETPKEFEEHLKLHETIRRALDDQTNILYEQYAREQYPKNPQKQKELVLEMQEQYFQKYMSKVYTSQLLHQQQQFEQWRTLHETEPSKDANEGDTGNEAPSDPPLSHVLPLIPATLWTRKDICEFKQEILKTQNECCIKIGSLATATVRVPTHPDGTSIFWEFATDHYDLGFGLYFEWDLEPQKQITVSVSESSDEDDGEDEDNDVDDPETGTHPSQDIRDLDDRSLPAEDLERGCHSSNSRVPTDELIPIYRRDCHTEVYCGSHQYPGVGVYVFKFDNSFSLWRSKWLYYRIYYAQ